MSELRTTTTVPCSRPALPPRRGPCPGAAAVVAAAVLALLHGCASVPQPPATAPQPAPATSAEKSVQRVTSLATERRWLQSWFHGTPVVIAQPDDATVTVDVPLVHDFDRGDSRIKPALAALLDKVAESLRRRPAIRLTRIAAPGDGSVGSLAARRAEAVRRHLLARGVPAVQLGEATTTAAPAVQLRLETPSG